MVTTHFLVVMNDAKHNSKPEYKLFPTEDRAEFFCNTLPPTTTYNIEMISEETDG